MKRVLFAILSAALVTALSACGQAGTGLPAGTAPLPNQTEPVQAAQTAAPAEAPEPESEPEAPAQKEDEPQAPLVEISELEAPLAEQPAKKPSGKTSSGSTNTASSKEYYVKVDRKACVTVAYTKDETGAYTVPYKAMLCSTGRSTPLGVYKLPNAQWTWLRLVGGVYGQYCTQIKGNYLFHSVPYTTKGDKGSLQWEEYDKLGTVCSHGCIRLSVADARWIYNNMRNIYRVEICEDAGLPAAAPAMKISGNELCRGWDPTDPDEGNPWAAWFAEQNMAPVNAEPEDPAAEDAAAPEPGGETAGEAPETPPEVDALS